MTRFIAVVFAGMMVSAVVAVSGASCADLKQGEACPPDKPIERFLQEIWSVPPKPGCNKRLVCSAGSLACKYVKAECEPAWESHTIAICLSQDELERAKR
jgi:hypothetical protein